MKPLLTRFLKDYRNRTAARYARGDILDLGCGSADILRLLDARGRYVGVDYHPGLIEGLRSRKDLPDTAFYLGDLDNLQNDFRDEFDTVLLVAVIEHLHEPEALLLKIRGSLADGGNLVITTPTPFADYLHRYLSRVGLTHKDAVQQHHRIFNKRDMLALLTSTGFMLEKYQRFELRMNQVFICRKD